MITTIKEWASYIAGNKLNEGRGGPDDVNIIDAGNKLCKIIFGKWTTGGYKTNDTYNYGKEYTFADGTKERGYVETSVYFTLEGKMLATMFTNPSALEELNTFITVKPDTKHTPYDYVSVTVEQVRMITSGRTEAKAYAGMRVIGGVNASTVLTNKNINDVGNEMKAKLMDAGNKADGLSYIKYFFDKYIGNMDLLKPVKKTQKTSKSDVGIGRHASTSFHHDIKGGYDVSEYIAKYGEDRLMSAINSSSASFFKKKQFRGIENGIMITDESWTDKYD